MLLKDFEREIKTRLEMDEFPFDISLNGVQVQCPDDKEIRRVAVAVDACQETIDGAAEIGADVLFVHHGLFWGQPIAISGMHYRRVKKLMDSEIALFACHLPLDAHPALGNNAQMAIALGMREYDMYSEYHGANIGVKGKLPHPMTREEIAERLGFSKDGGLVVLPFGKDEISTVGIISGSAGHDVSEAISLSLDAFITGVVPHEIYHEALESGMNVIGGGHYRSEVFGVKAVGRMLEREFGLECAFIERGTSL